VPGLPHPPGSGGQIRIVARHGNNLAQVTTQIPLGLFTCVTGVSGSGKSTLHRRHAVRPHRRAPERRARRSRALRAHRGLEQIDRVIDIDQSPIGRTPRSNPATYTGLFAPLRELFAAVPEARARGYDSGRFQLQRQGWTLRGLPGGRRDPRGNALPARRVRAV